MKISDKDLCTILEVEYLKNNNKLPIEWYQSDNYELKLEIISKAINTNKTINEIEEYKLIFNEANEVLDDKKIRKTI